MNTPETAENPGHERKDVDVIALVLIAVLVLFIGAMAILSCWALMHLFNRRYAQEQTRPPAVSAEQGKFPAPQLLQQSGVDYAGYLKQEKTDLNSYGWLDRPAGKVLIPINRAMQLLVERGLPDVGAGLTPLQLMQARPQTNEPAGAPIAAPTPEPTP